jgi:16S rRNA (uracil1498-N3)-methyltransferase
MTARYYAPHLSDADSCELEGAEFHHLTRVMRARPGDQVVLFDGAGHAADAEVVDLSKSRASLRILNRTRDVEEGPIVVLATAVPKADRFRWLVEKATELGISRLIPLQTARCVTEPGLAKLDKMRAAVIEACKQSGRNQLMTIDPLTEWQSFLSQARAIGRLIVADPSGAVCPTLREMSQGCEMRQGQRPLAVVIGPEGGLTDAEVTQAREAGGCCVSLGPRILRTETAAIALAALYLLPSLDLEK